MPRPLSEYGHARSHPTSAHCASREQAIGSYASRCNPDQVARGSICGATCAVNQNQMQLSQRKSRLHLVRGVYCSEASRGFATATGHHPHPSATAFLPGRDFATTDIPPSSSGVRRARATISAPGEPLGHHSIVQEKPKSVGEFIHTAKTRWIDALNHNAPSAVRAFPLRARGLRPTTLGLMSVLSRPIRCRDMVVRDISCRAYPEHDEQGL